MKVLVVEDSVTSATQIRQMLGKMGLETVWARNGEQGLEAFHREQPDLLLLDVIMPDMDGYELADLVRQSEQGVEWTPIIFISARANDEDLARGIEAGGDDYLTKPVSEIVLRAKIDAMRRIVTMRSTLVKLTHKLDLANRELERINAIDALTGAANRRRFDETLRHEWRRAIRRSHPLSLLFIDIDEFKQFNDGYGHVAGDECLRDLASLLESSLRRPSDLLARYGGEEFAVILPETDATGASAVAENLITAVREAGIPHEFSTVSPFLSVSIGVTTALPRRGNDNGYQMLVANAGEALYKAKDAGRNQVVPAV